MPDPGILARIVATLTAERRVIAVLLSAIAPIVVNRPPATYCAYCGRKTDPGVRANRRFCSDAHRLAAWKFEHKEAA